MVSFQRLRRLIFLGAFALLTSGLCAGAGAAAGGNRFKATAPDVGEGEGSELRTPLQFEEEAANNPLVSAQILFSRCRRAPFDSTTLYSPLAPPEHDAIVGDTTFGFADGSSCYIPQNEQNIVVDPANLSHLVTSANEYRYNAHVVYYSTDRGATWVNVILPGWTRSTGGAGLFGPPHSCGDPVLAFSPPGSRPYYARLGCHLDKF